MKFRIKQKGDQKYSRFYPQRKGWKTAWTWEYFRGSWYDIPAYRKTSSTYDYRSNLEIFFETVDEAKEYIEDYKAKHFEKSIEILSLKEQRKRKLKKLTKRRP